MTTPSYDSHTTPSTAATNQPLLLNLPATDPTGKLLLAVIFDYVVGAPATPEGWTKACSNGASVFWKIGEATDTGTLVIDAFSTQSKSPKNTGYVIAIDGATGIDKVSAVVTGVTNAPTCPALVSSYDNELLIAIFSAAESPGGGHFTMTGTTIIDTTTPDGGAYCGAQAISVGPAGSNTGTPIRTMDVATDTRAVAILVAGSRPSLAPTLLSPANNAALDRAVDNDFDWQFNDPDTGDTQTGYDFGLTDVTAATAEVVTNVTSATPSRTITGGTLTDGHVYKWRVRTYDSGTGTAGAWSPQQQFTAHTAPSAPTLTAPTDGETINSSPLIVTGASGDTILQVQLVGDNAGSADLTTVYYDSGAFDNALGVSDSFPTPIAANGHDAHLRVRVQQNGLWSPWTDLLLHISLTPPPAPTGTLTEMSADAAIRIDYTTPAPTGDQPTPTSVDVFVSTDNGETSQRYATGLPTDGSWTFQTPASDVDYQFLLRSDAGGITADSAWLTDIDFVESGGTEFEELISMGGP